LTFGVRTSLKRLLFNPPINGLTVRFNINPNDVVKKG
jgi:hypothetical protein